MCARSTGTTIGPAVQYNTSKNETGALPGARFYLHH
jgi:hypothetical protein